MGLKDRERRLRTAETRVVRPGTSDAEELALEESKFWDRIPVIGREDFLANKRALGRTKDLADAERLDPPKPGQGE